MNIINVKNIVSQKWFRKSFSAFSYSMTNPDRLAAWHKQPQMPYMLQMLLNFIWLTDVKMLSDLS